MRKEVEKFYRTYVNAFKTQKGKIKTLYDFINDELEDLGNYIDQNNDLKNIRNQLEELKVDIFAGENKKRAWNRFNQIQRLLGVNQRNRLLVNKIENAEYNICLLYTSPSPRDS